MRDVERLRLILVQIDDVAIVDRDGVTPHREFKFGALLYGMVRAELDELSPQLPTQLLHGALRGRVVAARCLEISVGGITPLTDRSLVGRTLQVLQPLLLHPSV